MRFTSLHHLFGSLHIFKVFTVSFFKFSSIYWSEIIVLVLFYMRMRIIYPSLVLWSIFQTISKPCVDLTTWILLKLFGIAKPVPRRGCRAGEINQGTSKSFRVMEIMNHLLIRWIFVEISLRLLEII